jgi:hypothetical protein
MLIKTLSIPVSVGRAFAVSVAEWCIGERMGEAEAQMILELGERGDRREIRQRAAELVKMNVRGERGRVSPYLVEKIRAAERVLLSSKSLGQQRQGSQPV